jgi:hypothetical protein
MAVKVMSEWERGKREEWGGCGGGGGKDQMVERKIRSPLLRLSIAGSLTLFGTPQKFFHLSHLL